MTTHWIETLKAFHKFAELFPISVCSIEVVLGDVTRHYPKENVKIIQLHSWDVVCLLERVSSSMFLKKETVRFDIVLTCFIAEFCFIIDSHFVFFFTLSHAGREITALSQSCQSERTNVSKTRWTLNLVCSANLCIKKLKTCCWLQRTLKGKG